MRYSVSTIDAPEFINLTPSDINPMISKCEIKVLYLGDNRNRTSISKDGALNLAKTLRGAPIVGSYRKDVDDFGDHGEKIVIENNEIKMSCTTQPYGFVDLNARAWFQKFNEYNEQNELVEREYLVTEGLLWTGQYEELQCLYDCGGEHPQSMELDEKTLQGKWAQSNKDNLEIFIINDGIFSKLCILGEDVEPCFEESTIKITDSHTVTNFSKNNNFNQTLYSMMKELKELTKGGQPVNLEQDTLTLNSDTPSEQPVADVAEVVAEDNEPVVENNETIVEEPADTFAKAKDDEEDKEDKADASDSDKEKDDEDKKKNKAYSKEEELAGKCQELESKYQELQSRFDEVQKAYSLLKKFKDDIEDKEKDAMINSFSMLSTEDKQDVIQNKAQYSLDQIESKLSVIYARIQKNIQENQESTADDAPVVTYSNVAVMNDVPDWVNAVRNNKKN